MLKVLTEMAKKQVEEGKYPPKPLKQGRGKIELVLQGGKAPDRKKANKTMVGQSNVKWEVAADLKGCERLFPIPTTKKPDLVIWSEEEKEVRLVELIGKQCISQSKLAAEDTSRLASQSG